MANTDFCTIKNCPNLASHYFSIYILPDIGTVGASAELGVRACPEHATKENAAALFKNNAPGRKYIEKFFHDQNLARPNWDRSTGQWVPIDISEQLNG